MKFRLLFVLDFIANAVGILAVSLFPALYGYALPLDRCEPQQSCMSLQLLSALAAFCLPASIMISAVIIPACHFGFSIVAKRNSFNADEDKRRIRFWIVFNAIAVLLFLASFSLVGTSDLPKG